MEKTYDVIYKHYETCFDKYGDNNLGVDWPNEKQAEVRYKIMLDVIKDYPCSLLDFGCGLSHLYGFMKERGYEKVSYTGLDISEKFIKASKGKYPENEYILKDCIKENIDRAFDYIVMNGVFTEKRELTYENMFVFFTTLISKGYKSANKGIVFNVMSKQVDWERDDLFHLPLDDLAWFLHKNRMRNFVIRNDYGLFEYSVYVYKKEVGE